jgi:hypothetical protein
MILAYPTPWNSSSPPVYLVCDDVAFYLMDAVTAHNFQRTGIPMVGMTVQDMSWIVDKLDPNVEHPLGVTLVRDPADPLIGT